MPQPYFNNPNQLTTDSGIGLNDPNFRVLFSRSLERNTPKHHPGLALMEALRGPMVNLMSGAYHGDHQRNAVINPVSFPNRTGTMQISMHVPKTMEALPGDNPQSPDDVGSLDEVHFSFGPQVFQGQHGWPIDNRFVQGSYRWNQIEPIEREFRETFAQFDQGLFFASLAGRLGMSQKEGWAVFAEGNETYNANQETQIKSHPSMGRVKMGPLNEPMQPTRILASWTDNWETTPQPDVSDATDSDGITLDLIRKAQHYINHRARPWTLAGLEWRDPEKVMIGTKAEMDTASNPGMYSRIPEKDVKMCVFLTSYQTNALKKNTDWLKLQSDYANSQGVMQGIATGQIGDIFGCRLYEMSRNIVYPGPGGIRISRGFFLGAGAMLQVSPRYEPLMGNYQTPFMKFTETLNEGGLMFDFITPSRGVGRKAALFWETYRAYIPVVWPLAPAGSALAGINGGKIGNIIAFDTVEGETFY